MSHMSQSPAHSLENRINLALESCLGKMADKLLKKFDVDDKESCSLFHQFCSAIRTRMQWLKSLAKSVSPYSDKNTTCSKSKKTPPNPPKTPKSPQLPDDFLEKMPSNQSPLSEKDLNNGLICQT